MNSQIPYILWIHGFQIPKFIKSGVPLKNYCPMFNFFINKNFIPIEVMFTILLITSNTPLLK